MTFQNLIISYSNHINVLNNKFPKTPSRYMGCNNIYNMTDPDFLSKKLIIVGDNPSLPSLGCNTYFAGDSGNVVKSLIRLLGFQDSEYMFFNKTALTLSQSAYIKKQHTYDSKKQTSKYNFDLDINMKFMAKFLIECKKINVNIKILIMGYAGLKSDKRCYNPFYQTLLTSNLKFLNDFYVFPHPSPRSSSFFNHLYTNNVSDYSTFLSSAKKIKIYSNIKRGSIVEDLV